MPHGRLAHPSPNYPLAEFRSEALLGHRMWGRGRDSRRADCSVPVEARYRRRRAGGEATAAHPRALWLRFGVPEGVWEARGDASIGRDACGGVDLVGRHRPRGAPPRPAACPGGRELEVDCSSGASVYLPRGVERV